MQIIETLPGITLPSISGYMWSGFPKSNGDEQTASTPGSVTISDGVKLGQMGDVVQKFKEAGINIKITSGVRENAVTSSGKKSKHASGEAIDVVPGEGETFESIYTKIQNSPELVDYLKSNGVGVLRETSNAALKRTGGSGFHLHIGTDKSARVDLDRLLNNNAPLLGRLGFKIK